MVGVIIYTYGSQRRNSLIVIANLLVKCTNQYNETQIIVCFLTLSFGYKLYVPLIYS